MATTSIWRIKGAIGDVIRYAENEKKTTKEILAKEKAREPTGSLNQLIAYASREEATNQRKLVTGINCSPDRARQEMMAVKKAFGTLKKADRSVFLRRYWYFESIGEIAARYRYSESKVKSMLKRTRDKLRVRLLEEDIWI